MANQKIRFEVFKRDGFKCQYCGRNPPDVVLETDHIIPKSQGGKFEVNNLITACFDCNRGKGKNNLKDLPESISNHLLELKEKRKQLKAYTKYLTNLADELDCNIESINFHFKKYYPTRCFTDNFKQQTIRVFLKHLPPIKIMDALDIAYSHFDGQDQTTATLMLKYFCGICWNWIKHPEMRDW